MSWPAFLTFLLIAPAAFLASHRGGGGRRGPLLSASLLTGLLLAAGLRHAPLLEARLLDPALYAHVRPWLAFLLALAFLGSAMPQLPERRRRLALGGLALFLFGLVSERSLRALLVPADTFQGEACSELGSVPQSTAFSCGAAASATLLNQHGIPATEREMVRRCLTSSFLGTDEVGVLKGLGEVLEGRPARAELRGIEADELHRAPLPAMARLVYGPLSGHWVVVRTCAGGVVELLDPLVAAGPSSGRTTLSLESFTELYDGVVVVIVDDQRTAASGG